MALALDALMLLVLAVAVYTDLSTRRIPNVLTLSAAAMGLVAHLLWQGLDGLGLAALGWLAGVGLLLVPFLLRGIGAGDLKLVAALGALQGPQFALLACLYGAIAGGLLAVVSLARARKLGLALKLLVLLRYLPQSDGVQLTAGRIPYAPALAAGALATLAIGMLP